MIDINSNNDVFNLGTPVITKDKCLAYAQNSLLPNIQTQNESSSKQTPPKIINLPTQANATFDLSKSENESNGHFAPKKKPSFRKLCRNIALELGFNVTSKGTSLLLEIAIYVYEKNLNGFNMASLFRIFSQKYTDMSPKHIRSSVDNSLKSMIRYSNANKIKSVLSEYQGEELNAKGFIVLLVYELRKKYPSEEVDDDKAEKILCPL